MDCLENGVDTLLKGQGSTPIGVVAFVCAKDGEHIVQCNVHSVQFLQCNFCCLCIAYFGAFSPGIW